LTDNGRVFTGLFNHPPVEMLFDRICRGSGIEHLLTAPRSPMTIGSIERFHRTLRLEFDTRLVFSSLRAVQRALDEWVTSYDTERPHQSLDAATPAERFAASATPAPAATLSTIAADPARRRAHQDGAAPSRGQVRRRTPPGTA
jgi:transposase InsO family protein